MTKIQANHRIRKYGHMDSAVRRRLESLFEALSQFEGQTARQATVIMVPHRHDEPTIVWEAGRRIVGADPVEGARAAVRVREQSALRA